MSTRAFTLERSAEEEKMFNIYEQAWKDWEDNYKPIEDLSIARSGLTTAARKTGMGMMTSEARQQAGQMAAQQTAGQFAAGINPGSGAFAAGQQDLDAATAAAVGSGQNYAVQAADNDAYQGLAKIAANGVSEGSVGIQGMGLADRYKQAADSLTLSTHSNLSSTEQQIKNDNLQALGTGIGTALGIGLQQGSDLFKKQDLFSKAKTATNNGTKFATAGNGKFGLNL